MPTQRVSLAGSFNQRTEAGESILIASKDQRFLNCVFTVVQNPITETTKVYVEKRPGWSQDTLTGAAAASTGIIKTDSFSSAIAAFGTTNATLYEGSTSIGTITGRALYFTETLIGNVGHILIKSSDGTGWYYVAGARDVTAYTADGNNSTTITDIKIAGANSTAGLYIGQKLSAATNIVAGSRIVSIDSGAFTAVLDTATIDGAFADLAITKEPVAKIIDSDFVASGTTVTAFVEMDGYQFYGNSDGYIYNSDLNSVTSYGSLSKLTATMAPDPPNALARYKNTIIVFGTASFEVFENVGNASGSPLQRMPQHSSRIGIQGQRSIVSLGDEIFYVSSSKYGELSIQRLRDLKPQTVSPSTVNKILGTAANSGSIYLSGFQQGGYNCISVVVLTSSETSEFLLLELGDNILLEVGDDIILEGSANETAVFGRMFVYNADLNLWSEWDTQLVTFITGASGGTKNQLFGTSRINTGGKIYTLNPDSDGELSRDDGSSYTMEIRTSKLDFGTEDRKFIHSIRLVADTQSTGTATLEVSDDDYASWRTLGTFDMTAKDKRIRVCGSHTGGRAYRLSHSANTPFRAEALEFDYTFGRSRADDPRRKAQ